MFPGKGSQARFPGTASQARLLGRGCQARRKQGFPVAPGNFALEPAFPGNACLRTLCLLGTLLGNGSWDLAWEPFLGTVLASGSCELNLAWEPIPGNLLGNVSPTA